MKKSFLIAAMAGLAFVGCTNDEVSNSFNQDREITFANPYVSKTTKAVYQEMENPYSTAEKFNVFGVWHKETFEGWATNASLYMDDATTQYDDTYNGWRPETRYYWPKNGYLTFAAYSPADASGAFTYDATGLHITGFQVAEANANHIDLMYSKRSYDKKKGSENTNVPYDEVDLDFQHALSSIHFTAKLAEAYTGTEITLNKISIYGVNTKGDFDEKVDETDPATYTAAPAWSNQDVKLDEANAYVYFDGSQVLTDGVFVMKDNASQTDVIALPQTLPATAVIKIEYTIDAPGASTPAIEQVNTVKIADLTTKTWEPGKRYIYNMTFSFEEIYFAPEILDWVNAPGTDIKVDDYQ